MSGETTSFLRQGRYRQRRILLSNVKSSGMLLDQDVGDAAAETHGRFLLDQPSEGTMSAAHRNPRRPHSDGGAAEGRERISEESGRRGQRCPVRYRRGRLAIRSAA